MALGPSKVGGQRPLGSRRPEGEGVAEPDPSQGPPQQAAERAREARQQDPFVGSGRMSSGPRATTECRAPKARIGLKNLDAWSNWSVSRRPCDDTRRRRPGDGLVAEITQRPRKSRLRHDNLVKQYPPGALNARWGDRQGVNLNRAARARGDDHSVEIGLLTEVIGIGGVDLFTGPPVR